MYEQDIEENMTGFTEGFMAIVKWFRNIFVGTERSKKTEFDRVLDLIRSGEIVIKSDGTKSFALFDSNGIQIAGWLGDGSSHFFHTIAGYPHSPFLGLTPVGEHFAKMTAAAVPSLEDLELRAAQKMSQARADGFKAELEDFDRRLKMMEDSRNA